MPIIECHLDDDVAKRLLVFARLNDREPNELASSWIKEAARLAIPCVSGKPTDPHQLRLWDTPEPA